MSFLGPHCYSLIQYYKMNIVINKNEYDYQLDEIAKKSQNADNLLINTIIYFSVHGM